MSAFPRPSPRTLKRKLDLSFTVSQGDDADDDDDGQPSRKRTRQKSHGSSPFGTLPSSPRSSRTSPRKTPMNHLATSGVRCRDQDAPGQDEDEDDEFEIYEQDEAQDEKKQPNQLQPSERPTRSSGHSSPQRTRERRKRSASSVNLTLTNTPFTIHSDQVSESVPAITPKRRGRPPRKKIDNTPLQDRELAVVTKVPQDEEPNHPPEKEIDPEAKKAAQAQKEQDELIARWTEDYYEIIEQLPLELHRSYALMRELESQMLHRYTSMKRNIVLYRDARKELQRYIVSKCCHEPKRASTETPSEQEAANQLASLVPQTSISQSDSPSQGQTSTTTLEPQHLDQATLQLSHIFNSPANQTHQPLSGKGIMGRQSRIALLRKISLAASEAVRVAEEKVGLAVAAYDWTDRHIRRLDTDMDKNQSSLVLGLRSGTEESRGVREALGLPVDGIEAHGTKLADGANGVNGVNLGDSVATPTLAHSALPAETPARRSARHSSTIQPLSTTNKRNKKDSNNIDTPKPSRGRKPNKSIVAGASLAESTDTVSCTLPHKSSPSPVGMADEEFDPELGLTGMAINPGEPRYCYCDQISFDAMIGCDNEDCQREWFHYDCVGLTSPPEGSWYCQFCAPRNWKGPGTFVPPNAKFKPSTSSTNTTPSQSRKKRK